MDHKITTHTGIEKFYLNLSKPFIWILLKTRVTPNQVTVLGAILGSVGAFCLLINNAYGFIAAALLITLSEIFDTADGRIAAEKNLQSQLGQWLDPFFDKLLDIILATCFVTVIYISNPELQIVVFGLLLMGFQFFIQFLMVYNDLLASKDKVSTDKINIGAVNKSNWGGKVSLIRSLHRLIPGFSGPAFLFTISFFSLLHGLNILFDLHSEDVLVLGLYFSLFWSTFTLLKIISYDLYRFLIK